MEIAIPDSQGPLLLPPFEPAIRLSDQVGESDDHDEEIVGLREAGNTAQGHLKDESVADSVNELEIRHGGPQAHARQAKYEHTCCDEVVQDVPFRDKCFSSHPQCVVNHHR